MRNQTPFDDVEAMMNQMFGRFAPSQNTVQVDIQDEGESLLVTADIPGYETDEIDISVDGNSLTISAVADYEGETEEHATHDNLVVHERNYTSVSRQLTLPSEVIGEDASASYTNGVLTIQLPKVSTESTGWDIQVD